MEAGGRHKCHQARKSRHRRKSWRKHRSRRRCAADPVGVDLVNLAIVERLDLAEVVVELAGDLPDRVGQGAELFQLPHGYVDWLLKTRVSVSIQEQTKQLPLKLVSYGTYILGDCFCDDEQQVHVNRQTSINHHLKYGPHDDFVAIRRGEGPVVAEVVVGVPRQNVPQREDGSLELQSVILDGIQR